MNTGELLTKGTIWISLLAYLFGSITFGIRSRHWDKHRATRIAWTIACFSLLLHFICAYQFYHDWSQDSAYSETARQTDVVVGLNWGGGLFINYSVLLIWLADIAYWWLAGVDSYQQKLWTLRKIWHAFLIFIIVNATIVFKSGLVRWVGLVYCIVLAFAWAGEPVRYRFFHSRGKLST
jgi:hypothetical protein